MKPGIASSRSDRSPNEHKSLAFNWLFPRLRESAMQGFWKVKQIPTIRYIMRDSVDATVMFWISYDSHA